MRSKCDSSDTSTELELDSPTFILLSNNRRAVADRGDRVWCIRLYLRAIFVATPTGSGIEIFLRFDGVPELDLAWSSMLFLRTCLQWSVFFSVYPFSVRGRIFTCTSGSVIFSNM